MSLFFIVIPPTHTSFDLSTHSFQQSCHEIHIKKRNIQASCLKSNGAVIQTNLRNWKKCSGDIANQNGKLHCNEKVEHTNINGSFLQTCASITFNGQNIQAICQKMNGEWMQTHLFYANTCKGDIANLDGHLQCLK